MSPQNADLQRCCCSLVARSRVLVEIALLCCIVHCMLPLLLLSFPLVSFDRQKNSLQAIFSDCRKEREAYFLLQLQLHSNLLSLMSEYIRVHIHEFLSPHNSCKLERGPSKRPALTTCPISYNRAAIMHAITNSAFQICSSAPRGIPHRSWLFSSTK